MGTALRVVVAVALALAASGKTLAAEFRLAIEASYPPGQAEEIYKPLIAYLNGATGHTFTLVVPRNYHFLWRDLKRNEPTDFAFEEAHFADYRLQRHGFRALVRTAEPTSYALVSTAEQAALGIDGLVGKRIACMPSPSLGFALLAEMFKNPVAQPDIRSEATSWRDGVEMLFAGEADAALVQTYIAKIYSENSSSVVVMTQTRDFPGRLLSAAPGVDAAVAQAVADAMLKLHEDPSLFDVLNEIGASRFEPATAAEYAGSEEMLKGFFGYQAR